MSEVKTTIRIDTVEKVEKQTRNTDQEYYVIKGRDTDGATKVQITTPNVVSGFKPDEVVDVIIKGSQTSLKEFEKKDE